MHYWQGSEKPRFYKKPNPLGFFGFYWVLGFIGFFRLIYICKSSLEALLVDLAHQRSFYLDSPVL